MSKPQVVDGGDCPSIRSVRSGMKPNGAHAALLGGHGLGDR